MGLDMYAYSVPAEDVIDDFSFQKDSANQFFYWRKHNALHGWMEDLYKAKGGKESFNYVPVRLSVENLLELKECIQNCSLTPRAGFFWGAQSEYDTYTADRDMQFVNEALAIVYSGGAVYYNSWW
jgi:hypothetical protein